MILISDVVIGAYLSDQAVLLYGQPVISLDATMEIRNTLTNQVTSFIEQDASNTAVYVCFSYRYNKCPKMCKYTLNYYSFDYYGLANRYDKVTLENHLGKFIP